MAIIGIGIDIIKISRVKKLLIIYKNKFAKRILSKNELIKYYKLIKQKERFLAKRFAIKEAAVKALGIGIRQGITFNQFEVYNNLLGKPKIKFFSKVSVLSNKLGIKKVHLTLTDEKNYACALIILES